MLSGGRELVELVVVLALLADDCMVFDTNFTTQMKKEGT